MRQIEAGGGRYALPVIGQGTWGLGTHPRDHAREVDALRQGFALGMTLVDTAEIYAAGESERVVGDAIADCRDEVFVVSKVWPHHTRPDALLRAVEASLRRLRTDHLDALLLHWPVRSVPLPVLMRSLYLVRARGLSREVGVSNFPATLAADAAQALGEAAEANGDTPPLWLNELPYSLEDRRVERSLLADTQSRHGVLLAYSPLGHGRLLPGRGDRHAVLTRLARKWSATPAQIALAFVVQAPGVVALPKAVQPDHVRDNAAAGDLRLDADDMAALDAAFGGPRRDLGFDLPTSRGFFALAYGALRLWQTLRGRAEA